MRNKLTAHQVKKLSTMDRSHLALQSRLPPLNADSLETIEDIKKTISKLRDEQQNIFSTQNKIVSSFAHKDHGIDKIFEHCCLISMVRRAPYLLGAWPIAMVGSLVNKTVSLGNFESYGSLWRFVRIGDTVSNSNSVRVVLECSEIGEKPLYLTNNLELTENNNYAAEWWATKTGSKDEFCITLHTVDDKRFLCAHQDTADLTLIADQAALSHTVQASSASGDLADDASADAAKPTALFSNYWNYEWAVTSEDAITLSSGKLEESLSFLDSAEE